MVQIIELKENPDYLFYSDGRMWSKKFKKFLKPQLIRRSKNQRYIWGRGGYLAYNINRKILKIHRLLGQYFIPNPNPNEFNCVIHLNDRQEDNRLENLQWANHTINMQMFFANRKSK